MEELRRKRLRGRNKNHVEIPVRVKILKYFLVAIAVILSLRLFYLQVVRYSHYDALASAQHDLVTDLTATRGTIYMQDYETGSLVPVATSQQLGFVFVNPSEIEDVQATVDALVSTLKLTFGEEEREGNGEEIIEAPSELIIDPEAPVIVGTELDGIIPSSEPEFDGEESEQPDLYDRFVERLSDDDDPYEPVKHGVPENQLSALRELDFPGVYYTREPTRLYPEEGIGGHVIGFLGRTEENETIGQYGVEGYYDELLSGEDGYLKTQKDISGREITVGNRDYLAPKDGADVVLTIDRTIQFMACKALREQVLLMGASGGAVVIMDPKTGDILAMCGYPDFDPSNYSDVGSINDFNNPATFGAYEPGSIFKPVTMAAGLDIGVVTPSSEYEDTGLVEVPPFTIRNSDKKAHGIVTMTEVLEKSLNTGVVYVLGETGNDVFREYVKKFGFGVSTELGIETEVSGDISSLEKRGDIFAITASYGQGITATPIQLVQAYSAIANDGILVKPRIVREIRYADGLVKENEVQLLRRVISQRTSRLLSAMLVSVIENGHGSQAAVPGYFIAGKTGTAQIAGKGGYIKDATIGSFVGFGPVDDPKFIMLTRIDRPEGNEFSATTAAPLFGRISQFLLEYLNIPPSREY